jgi:hypothetical protein
MSKCGIWLRGQKGVFVFMLTKMVFLVCEIYGWQHLFSLWGAFKKRVHKGHHLSANAP